LKRGDASETTISSFGILEIFGELGFGVVAWDFTIAK
jgi:hypothetical protein